MHAWKGFSGSLHDQWTMLRFNAPLALALEIKKSLPWADGHQLHFMMHLSFCGWGVLISAGSREMSQNTWFLNAGKETGRERKTARLKNNLYIKMWKSTAFTVRVWLHTDWHISPWGHTSAVFIPRHQCLGENDSLTVRSGRWLCTLHIRETEKGHMWFDWNGQKKNPHQSHLSAGGCQPDTEGAGFRC